MLEFIAKYWLEFLFGLVALGVSAIAKHYYNLVKFGKKYNKEHEEQAQDNKMAAAISELGKELKEQIAKNHARDEARDKKIDSIMEGLLFLQKRDLLMEASRLLQPDHIIAYEEFMSFTKAHCVYNGLGGNHEGDEAYEAVKKKYYNNANKKMGTDD